MNPGTSRKLVLVSMVVTSVAVGFSFFKNRDRNAGQGFRTAWALGALYLVLSISADMAPEIAGPLALLIMLSAIIFSEQLISGMLHVAPGGADQQAPAGPAGPGGTTGPGQATTEPGGLA